MSVDGRAHVVVVDDRADRRRVLTGTLQSGPLADAEVSEVEGVALALAVVRSRPVDAVLVEISVPGCIGLIADIRRMRADVVILVCSFQTDAATRGRALDAGATAYLTKPLSVRQLHRAVTGAPQSAHAEPT